MGVNAYDTIFYERIPVHDRMDSNLSLIASLLDVAASYFGSQWSFVGGVPRDIYFDKLYHDYDVCIAYNLHSIIQFLEDMGVLIDDLPNQERESHTHFYLFNPYQFRSNPYPIHFISAEEHGAFAPLRFDYTINHLSLKSNGYLYVPHYVKKDLERRILRKSSVARMGTTEVMRAIRFACRYELAIHPDTEEAMKNRIQLHHDEEAYMGTDILLKHARKMQKDGLDDLCFDMMKKFHLPYVEEVNNLSQYIKLLNDQILYGKAVLEGNLEYDE